MIAFLTGRLVAKAPTFCVLDVGGVGYKLAMSTGSLAALPAEGDEVTIHTYLYVREDEMSLFGFERSVEKAAFEQLITVSGVGPKVALATLSALTPEMLSGAVASEDVALISSVPGIGKKTAQRMILDLADKLAPIAAGAGWSPESPSGTEQALASARDALLSMGFSPAEASVALKGADGTTTQELLKHALRRLGRRD